MRAATPARAAHLLAGEAAEASAERYLQAQGLTTVCKNFHSAFGEIDLIMRDRDALVFIEVRHRKERGFGAAVATVTRAKQRKIVKTALYYLATAKVPAHQVLRFDVVGTSDDASAPIVWLTAAFDAEE